MDHNKYFQDRTNRNRNVINPKEQELFRNGIVGIAGLSVGSSILMTMVQNGGPKRIRIADFDVIEASNLNRLRGTVDDLGTNKTQAAAKHVRALDPEAELTLFENGITPENLEEFVTGLDVFVDEMDSLDLKIKSRILCRKLGIPVIMATDNGDGAIVDIERFDLEPEREIFHGRLGNIDPDTVKDLPKPQWIEVANKIIGVEFLTPRMLASLPETAKTLQGIPQLATAAAISGGAATYALRMILTKQPIKSGKYVISPEEIFA